ncbi:SlyX family protein [Moraxella haemolytica]|uniref:SlyX family protein n=1 Tax=Moraxella TaxID=475 RepID=UPI002542D436|nr:SlyX family protein [Moraxella sp. ZY171148]WII96071.1 SlyX family protein [Moraxella sp. ZY171148]
MTDVYAQMIDLQIKLAYLESTVETLNEVIVTQDRKLKDLQDQLKLIYRHLQNQYDDDGGIAPFDLLADKPPHY